VNCEFDPVTFCYQALWRHKASLHFYEVFNDFVLVLKELLFGRYTPRISDQVDIGGHPPFPTGSKQFSGNFGNLLFLAVLTSGAILRA
jgi:hypothetical protein